MRHPKIEVVPGNTSEWLLPVDSQPEKEDLRIEWRHGAREDGWFGKRTDKDFHAKIESHLPLETDRFIADGMPPTEMPPQSLPASRR